MRFQTERSVEVGLAGRIIFFQIDFQSGSETEEPVVEVWQEKENASHTYPSGCDYSWRVDKNLNVEVLVEQIEARINLLHKRVKEQMQKEEEVYQALRKSFGEPL